jgi:hypothetical protein
LNNKLQTFSFLKICWNWINCFKSKFSQMSQDLSLDNNVLSNKLKHHFKDNIKLSLKTEDKIFIKWYFYKININEIHSELFLESGDYSIIEEMKVK